MKKILIIIAIFLASNAYAQTEMGWTTAINNNWSAMVSAMDPYYLAFKADADNEACSYANFGLNYAVMYKVTGTASYCDQAADSAFDCVAGASRNATRNCFTERALAYSICGSVVDAGRKATWETNLDAIVLQVLDKDGHGTRKTDTDELMGHSMGCWIYDAAKDNVPGNQCTTVSGTGSSYSFGEPDDTPVDTLGGSVRDAVYYYWNRYGQQSFVEGSEYNKNTLFYTLLGYHALNDYYGTDVFPEITSALSGLADQIYQRAVSSYITHFQWGDNQNIDIANGGPYYIVPMLDALGFLDNDANIRDYTDSITVMDDPGCSTNDSGRANAGGIFHDHDATRTKKSGETSHGIAGISSDTDSRRNGGMGLAYLHEGWNTNDTAFYSYNKPRFVGDHDWRELENWSMWKDNQWVINHVRLYYGGFEIPLSWINGLQINGAFGSFKEAKGQIAYEYGSGYMYHAGTTGGHYMDSQYDDPTPPWVDESTNQKLFRLNPDGTETVIISNRVKACNPNSTQCMSTWKKNRLNGNSYQAYNRLIEGGGDHQWVLNTQGSPTQSGNTWSYTANNGDNVDIFVGTDAYSVNIVNMTTAVGTGTFASCNSPYYFCGARVASEMTDYQFREVIDTADTKTLYNLLNVVHVGTPATYTKLTDNGGDEDVKGVMVENATDRVVALFNAEDDTTTTFTSSVNGPPNGFSAYYDPDRFAKTESMSHFKVGSTVQFTTDDTKDIEVFILGLDHTKGWTITKNGSSAGCTVSNEGVCKFTITGSAQTHTVTWVAGGLVCTEQSCSACTEEECVIGNCSWNGMSCEDTPPCDSNTCQNCDATECAAEVLCEFVGGTCQVIDQCPNVPSECTNQTDCESNGHCWENNLCISECTPPVGGTEVTFTPSKDVFIRNGSFSNTNYDTQGLNAKHTSNQDFHRASLIEFDLSSLTDVQIQSARLEVTCNGNGNNLGVVNVFPLLRNFVENEATANIYSTGNNWTTKMALGNGFDITGNGLTGSGALTSYSIGGAESDGTAVLFSSTQAMVDHIQSNLGGTVMFAIHQEQNDDANFTFYDSENSTPSNRPTLRIIYETTGEVINNEYPTNGGGSFGGTWGG